MTQLYAGLVVLTWDIHHFLAHSSRDDARWLEEAVASVNIEEKARHGPSAFSYDDVAFPHLRELLAFPVGLAEAACSGNPAVSALGDPAILHEWTVKPGKRLIGKFKSEFRSV